MINGPQVSFITICYNGFKDTCELIESLQNKIHSVSYEIIVEVELHALDEELYRRDHRHYDGLLAFVLHDGDAFVETVEKEPPFAIIRSG